MTAVLFLDVDGVLNHRACYKGGGGMPLCPEAIRRLNGLVSATGCKVVLSSTWRTMPGAVDRLKRAGGFPSPHDDWRTIEMRGRTINGLIIPDPRGAEIAFWLDHHSEVERFAIVDDDDDMLPVQKPFFVQTTFETGLLDEHVERLATILGAS